jgi:hypothetical protein
LLPLNRQQTSSSCSTFTCTNKHTFSSSSLSLSIISTRL